MREWLRRAWYLIRHRQLESELREEIEFHRAMKERDLERSGLRPGVARVAAQHSLGNDLLARDRARDVWVAPWLQDVAHDLRFGIRMLAKERAFTAVAVTALGLGIGVNNTLFSIVNAYCIRGLPIDQPDRVVYMATIDKSGRGGGISYPEFQDLEAAAQTFGRLAAFAGVPVALRDEHRAADRYQGIYISAGAFRLLGESPVLGRDFREDDDRPGAPPVVILGSGIWKTRFGSDPRVLGRAVIINGVPATVVGVMRDRFGFPSNTDVWQPLALMRGIAAQPRDARALGVIGRLHGSATLAQARADVERIGARMLQDHPETSRDIRYTTVTIQERYLPSITDPAWIAFGTTGLLVVLIACANVANLLLARAVRRTREIAIRVSLGASRRRVVRQLLVESTLLAAGGGAVGFGLSLAGLRLMTWAVPASAQPYWLEFSIDTFAFAVLAGMCLGTVFVFGLVPAMHASKTDANEALREGGRAGAGIRARRWTAVFLTAEVALTMILLSAVKEGFETHVARLRADQVLDTSNLLTMMLSLPVEKYADSAQRFAFYDSLTERLSGIGAIVDAAMASTLPIAPVPPRDVEIEDRPAAVGQTPAAARAVTITKDYFSTLRVPLIAGRSFTALDGRPGQESAIVNQAFAAAYFSGRNALGRRIRFSATNSAAAPPPWLTIVGVSPSVRQGSDRLLPDAVVYVPVFSNPPATTAVIVRTTSDAVSVASLLREEVRAIDPDLPVYRILTMEQAIAEATWNPRLSQWMIAIISFIAVCLSMVGLYAVTAHGVAQRTREIGVRLALGAHPRHVRRLIIRRAAVQLAAGLVAGAVCTYGWRKLIFGEVSTGIADLAVVAALMLVVAAAACAVPTRRAMRVDPVVALRME